MRRFIFIFLLLLPLSVNAQETHEVRGDGPDNVLEYVPYAAALTMKLAGVESSSSWKRFGVNATMSLVLTGGTTLLLKHTIHERRPDYSDNHSFPSGHSAIAFAGATVLLKEYSHVSPWIPVAGYAVAAYVAVDRVDRNKHHWFDVISGAGLGFLCTEAAYWIGDKITGEHSRYSVGVSGNSLSMVVRF